MSMRYELFSAIVPAWMPFFTFIGGERVYMLASSSTSVKAFPNFHRGVVKGYKNTYLSRYMALYALDKHSDK
jgi:hypothetical protein